MSDNSQGLQFEEAFEKLEQIVAQLEQGDLRLQDSLHLYEEGMLLASACSQMLDQTETRLKELTRDENGDFQITPMLDE